MKTQAVGRRDLDQDCLSTVDSHARPFVTGAYELVGFGVLLN